MSAQDGNCQIKESTEESNFLHERRERIREENYVGSELLLRTNYLEEGKERRNRRQVILL